MPAEPSQPFDAQAAEVPAASAVAEVAIERVAGGTRTSGRDRVVCEAPLQLRARGVPVATILRTPGHDLELVRGLLHAESIAAASDRELDALDATVDSRPTKQRANVLDVDATARARWLRQVETDAVDIDVDASAFAGRGLLSSAACGVCGRVAIADLEQRAREVVADTSIAASTITSFPDELRSVQSVFAETGGLHAAGLFTTSGQLIASREDVGRHNAVDKLVGWALEAGIDPARHALFLSGRLGYELVQKAIRIGVPIVAAVSAPSSLAIELAERFNIALVGFVRGERSNVYSHGWRIR